MAETIGAAIITAVASAEAASATIAGTSITYSAVVGTVALTAASIGLQIAFATGPGNAPKPENGREQIRQPIPPPIYGYGRNRIAGAFACSEADEDGNSIDIMGLHDGRVCGFTERFWLHDDEVALTPTNYVQTQDDGRYGGDNILIGWRVGLDTEATFSAAVALLDVGVWTNDHRGDFTAQLFCQANHVEPEQFSKIYPHGLPKPSAEVDCKGCFDPRVGTHLLAERSTWETTISYNPIIQLINFITAERGGMAEDYEEAIAPNQDLWIEAANNCDEEIELSAGGTEPRYRSAGLYTSETENIAVIQNILNTCDGWLGEAPDGSLIPFVGRYKAEYADMTLTDEIVRGFTINYDVSDEEAVNELQISFTWPDAGYSQVDVDPWIDEDDIESRGARIAQPFAPSWVQSFTQARRLGKRKMNELRAPMRGQITTTLGGVEFYRRRWVNWQSANHPDLVDGIVIEIKKREIQLSAASVVFDYVMIDPDTIDEWTPVEDEGDPPELADRALQHGIPIPENVEAEVVGTDEETFHLDVSFDNPEVPTASYSLRYRMADDGTGSPGVWTERHFGSNDAIITTGRVTLTIVPGVAGLLEVQVAVWMGRTRGDFSESIFVAAELPSLDFALPQNSGYFLLLQF